MPLSASDRKLFLIGGSLLAVVLVAIGVFSRPDRGDVGYPSSYNVERRGAKAAYLLLKQSGYRVERWEQSPEVLPPPGGTLLILADPRRWPERNESDALHKWIATGGTLLVAEDGSDLFAPFLHVRSGPYRDPKTTCVPAAPTALSRSGPIVMSGTLAWDTSADVSQVVHYACDKDAVVVSYAVGKGRVIWWASADPLTNYAIRDQHNLDLLLNTVGGFQRILWDEYYFAPYRSVWSYAGSRTLRIAEWEALLLAIILVLTYARRSGPLMPLRGESRLSPLEFVDTLGKLYHKAGAAQAVVEVGFNRFRQLLAQRLGLYGKVSAEQMARALSRRSVGTAAEMPAVLQRCEDAITDPNLTEREALTLVQKLTQATSALRLVPDHSEEIADASNTGSAVPHEKTAQPRHRRTAGVH